MEYWFQEKNKGNNPLSETGDTDLIHYNPSPYFVMRFAFSFPNQRSNLLEQ